MHVLPIGTGTAPACGRLTTAPISNHDHATQYNHPWRVTDITPAILQLIGPAPPTGADAACGRHRTSPGATLSGSEALFLGKKFFMGVNVVRVTTNSASNYLEDVTGRKKINLC